MTLVRAGELAGYRASWPGYPRRRDQAVRQPDAGRPLPRSRPGPSLADDRRRLLSYIWPDEPERFQRLQAALAIAVRDPLPIARSPASEWLASELEHRQAGELTIVWHSVVRQYVPGEEWAAVIECLREASAARTDRPIVRVAMEPRREHVVNFVVALHAEPDGPGQILARCGDHGPPVVWKPPAPTAG